MFPSAEDARVHRSSASRRKNQEVELSRRASEIKTPDELISFILEIAGMKYRQGNRSFSFKVMVPVENFKPWALSTKIVSNDMDQLDRLTIRAELKRIAKNKIRPQLARGTYLSIEAGSPGTQVLSFAIKCNIVKHP